MWNWGDLDKQTDLPTEIRKVLDQITEEKIGYEPTLQVMHGLRAYFDPEYLKMRVIPKVTIIAGLWTPGARLRLRW